MTTTHPPRLRFFPRCLIFISVLSLCLVTVHGFSPVNDVHLNHGNYSNTAIKQ